MQCGTLLQGTGAAERRVVTVLFADLVGSTRLTKQLDPEPMRTLIARFFAAMREEIARYGGTIEKFIGDAVMAVFGMPAAHEDDPERALRAALAMQRRMVSLNADLETDLHLRIAIATGEVVADLLAAAAGQFMVTGEVVNFAARLQTQAPPDGIVMDERTCEATRHAIAYEMLPLVESAEFGARPRFRVIGLTNKPPTRRLQAEMIGRDEEMQFLQALYRRVVEGRHPHLVTVIAAAGIGKTRLVEEFLQRLTHHDPPPHVLRGRCPAYGEGLTYWPLLEMLKQECDITDYDPVPVAGQKLHDAVLRVCEPVLGRDESEVVADDLATMAGTEIPRDYNTLWKTRLARLKTLAEGRPVAVRDPSVGSETSSLRTCIGQNRACWNCWNGSPRAVVRPRCSSSAWPGRICWNGIPPGACGGVSTRR